MEMSIANRSAASLGEGDDIRSKAKELVRARFRRKNEEGQALVEFALVLPVLLLVVTGILVFSVFLNNYLTLTDAVSTGARQLSISRGQTTDPCKLTDTTIENAAPFITPGSLTFTFVLNGATYSGASCSSGSTSTGAAGNLVAGQSAKVTVTYPCNLAVYGTSYACNLTAQTTEIVQ
jgi:Flp pilus assembly protein TadG